MESNNPAKSLTEVTDLIAMVDELLKPSNSGRLEAILPGVRITVRQIRETLNEICDRTTPLATLGCRVEKLASDQEGQTTDDGSQVIQRRKELRTSIERIMGLQSTTS